MFGRLDLAPQTVEIRPGERLVLYTDGITDAQAPDGARYGDARLLDTIRDTCDRPRGGHLSGGHRWRPGFQGDADPADDLAFLVLRRLPAA